jgi:hypothetical protein
MIEILIKQNDIDKRDLSENFSYRTIDPSEDNHFKFLPLKNIEELSSL